MYIIQHIYAILPRTVNFSITQSLAIRNKNQVCPKYSRGASGNKTLYRTIDNQQNKCLATSTLRCSLYIRTEKYYNRFLNVTYYC